jgi:hypothetical protein
LIVTKESHVMSQVAVAQPKPVSTFRKVAAGFLDFIFIMFTAGYVIAYFTGGLTENGFQLNGAPAFAVFATIKVSGRHGLAAPSGGAITSARPRRICAEMSGAA